MRRLAALLLAAAGLMAAADLDHTAWDSLVKRYVNAEARVDYGRWKLDGVASLDGYLATLAARWPVGMTATAEIAALINAYNALTVRWVLGSYPVESIWKTSHPFTETRHTLNGAKVSLDAIEGRLRKMGDPRIHGALVCAARSCPPLRGEAYRSGWLDEQLDDNMRRWLGNDRLNQFAPDTKTARVSEIFKWYKGDFEAASGSVNQFLARYGRQAVAIGYIPYNWGLNDAGGRGAKYGKAAFLVDYLRNK